MPPFEVPSSFVSATSLISTILANASAWRQAVLPGVRIEDQQHFLRRIRHRLLHHATDLPQLLHQVIFGVQATRRVDDQHIGVALVRRLHRVERDRAGVGPGLVRDHRHIDPLAPELQLVDRRRAERIARRHDHLSD